MLATDCVDAVQNVSLDPIQDVYHVNDKVVCKARGQPIPDVHLHVGPPLPGSQASRDAVVIPAEWVGLDITLTCTAENTVNGEPHEASFTKTIHVTAATGQLFTSAFFLTVTLVLIVRCILFVSCTMNLAFARLRL